MDLTKGKPFKLIFLFSLPILLSTFLQQAYNLVDAVIVGQFLDSNYFGAVSASNTLMQLFLALMTGLATGASVVVSQLFGARRYNELKRAVSTILISMLSFTVLLSAIGFIFTKDLLRMMNVVPEYLDAAAEYLRIIFLGLIAMMAYNLYSGMLRGVGNSKAPLYFLIVSTIINIVLDLWFVGIWGVRGIAIATVTANVISALLCVFYTKKKVSALHVTHKEIKFDKSLFKKVIMTGLPPALEQMCMYVSILLLQIIVSSFDIGTGQTIHLSGYGVGNRIIDFLHLPLFAIGNALSAYAAQNRGAGETERVKKGYWAGLLLTAIMLCFTVIPGLIFSEQLIGLIINVDGGATTAEVVKVVLDEEAHRIEVVVPDDQLSLAIGRRGQNVRLASQLTGWYIDILTEAEESERRQSEAKVRTRMFMDALDVDDMIAHLLVAEGFTSVEEVAFVPTEDISSIEGFDEDLAAELQNRAKAFVEKQNAEFAVKSKELGVDESLINFEGLTQAMIVKLAEKGIKTLDDFADLANDELLDILGEDTMTAHDADALIMKAREHWFDEDGNPKA